MGVEQAGQKLIGHSLAQPLSFSVLVPNSFYLMTLRTWLRSLKQPETDDSLGGVKHDKLPAFNFRSFFGDLPENGLLFLISFTYRTCNLRIFHASVC